MVVMGMPPGLSFVTSDNNDLFGVAAGAPRRLGALSQLGCVRPPDSEAERAQLSESHPIRRARPAQPSRW